MQIGYDILIRRIIKPSILSDPLISYEEIEEILRIIICKYRNKQGSSGKKGENEFFHKDRKKK